MTEIWKNIENYEEYYQVSNLGNIRNKRTNKLLAGDTNNVGYKRVVLYTPVSKRFFVHRLVAYHFCDGYAPDKVVNHKDGNKQNNEASNLEWVTRSENDLHAYQTGLRKCTGCALMQKEKAKRQILVYDFISGSLVYTFKDSLTCAKYFNMNHVYIQQCCRGLYLLKGKYKLCYK